MIATPGIKQLLDRAAQFSNEWQKRGRPNVGEPVRELENRLLFALDARSFEELAQSYEAMTRASVTGGAVYSSRLIEGASAALERLQARTYAAKLELRRATAYLTGDAPLAASLGRESVADPEVERCRAAAERLDLQEQIATALFPLLRRREIKLRIEDCHNTIDAGRKQIADLQRRLQRERREVWRTRLERDLMASEERINRALAWSEEFESQLQEWHQQHPDLSAALDGSTTDQNRPV